MDLKLKIVGGKNAGQEIRVPGKKFFIGRSEDCHLRPGSDLISRHHCVLLVDEGYVALRDFGSKNGTYVNNERVVNERELKAGDCVRVGPLEFEVQMSTGLGGKKRPPVSDLKEAAARTAENRSSDDLDVTAWLSEPDSDSSRVIQPINISDTAEIEIGRTRELPIPAELKAFEAEQKAAPEEPAGDSKIKGGRPEKKPVGKLPTVVDASKDSREAAANVLSKFRKRR